MTRYTATWADDATIWRVATHGTWWQMPSSLLTGIERFGLGLTQGVIGDKVAAVLEQALQYGMYRANLEARAREAEGLVRVRLFAHVRRADDPLFTLTASYRAHGCGYRVSTQASHASTEFAIGRMAAQAASALTATAAPVGKPRSDEIWVIEDTLTDMVRCDERNLLLRIDRVR